MMFLIVVCGFCGLLGLAVIVGNILGFNEIDED